MATAIVVPALIDGAFLNAGVLDTGFLDTGFLDTGVLNAGFPKVGATRCVVRLRAAQPSVGSGDERCPNATGVVTPGSSAPGARVT